MNSYIERWDNIYCERHVLNLIETICPKIIKYYNNNPIYFIDIGANVGKVYDLLSTRINIKKSYMFEANSKLYEYLNIKYKNNTNISIYHNAIGITEDFVYFDESSMEYQINNNITNLNFGLSMISQNITNKKVQGLRISKFIEDNSFLYDELCFIKIDTENFDYQILLDLSTIIHLFKKKPIIEFENNYFCTEYDVEWAQNIINQYVNKGDYKELKIHRNMGDGILEPVS